MRRLLALCLLIACACIVAACDVSGRSAPPPTRVPTSTPAPTDTPAPTLPPTASPTMAPPPTLAIDTTEVNSQLVQVEADAAKLRGLKPKAKVPAHFISPDEMRYNMAVSADQEYTRQQADRDAIRYWLMLYIDDPSMDFLQMEKDFGGQEVLGYYDPAVKELFVKTDGATLPPQARETLAHEFTHSLQDQYFDLSKLMPAGIDHDTLIARKALVEGDATISGIMYAYKNMDDTDYAKLFESDDIAPPVPGRAPVYLQEGWQFPYKQGSEFVATLLGPGLANYKAVNAVFANPPDSTEQIMHPEKLLAKHRDEPMPVDLPPLTDTLGTGWAFQETDTVGEFDLNVMLRENFVDEPAATDGWGGARYALYQNPEASKSLLIMGTRWDTNRDADEFQTALENSFKLFQQHGSLWNDNRRVFGVQRSGDMIVFVSGTDLTAVQSVLASLKP